MSVVLKRNAAYHIHRQLTKQSVHQHHFVVLRRSAQLLHQLVAELLNGRLKRAESADSEWLAEGVAAAPPLIVRVDVEDVAFVDLVVTNLLRKIGQHI